MNKEEAKRAKFIKFIKSNNPFYVFSNFELHSMEQLDTIKKEIEREIKTIAEKNKQKNTPTLKGENKNNSYL